MAASIIAKVERDKLMDIYARAYPEFGFKKNKNTTVYDLNVDDIAFDSNIKVKYLERFDENSCTFGPLIYFVDEIVSRTSLSIWVFIFKY